MKKIYTAHIELLLEVTDDAVSPTGSSYEITDGVGTPVNLVEFPAMDKLLLMWIAKSHEGKAAEYEKALIYNPKEE